MIDSIKEAEVKDIPMIQAFADRVGVTLPEPHERPIYLMLVKGGALSACIGLTQVKSETILRALIVDAKQTNIKEILVLLKKALEYAAEYQASHAVYLLTETPHLLLQLARFKEVEAEHLPPVLRALPLFQEKTDRACVLVHDFLS